MTLFEPRKSNRLDYDYSSPGAYFITICTKDRANILSKVERDIISRSIDIHARHDIDTSSVGASIACPNIDTIRRGKHCLS